MALSHRLKPGDSIQIGNDIKVTILPNSYGTNIRVAIDAPRATAIGVVKTPKPPSVDDTCQ